MRPNNNKGARKAKRAFTLPMVILIVVIASGFTGALMVIYENYRGRSTLLSGDRRSTISFRMPWRGDARSSDPTIIRR